MSYVATGKCPACGCTIKASALHVAYKAPESEMWITKCCACGHEFGQRQPATIIRQAPPNPSL